MKDKTYYAVVDVDSSELYIVELYDGTRLPAIFEDIEAADYFIDRIEDCEYLEIKRMTVKMED